MIKYYKYNINYSITDKNGIINFIIIGYVYIIYIEVINVIHHKIKNFKTYQTFVVTLLQTRYL